MDKIAIISTRLGGIDGVSIEAKKWADALRMLGLVPVFIAGNFTRNCYDKYVLINELDFNHPDIVRIKEQAFTRIKDIYIKEPNLQYEFKLRELLVKTKDLIKTKINSEIKKLDIRYISIENALSLPLNIPLGIALAEIIFENRIKTIARHHDFYWERKEFLKSRIEDILIKYFPPDLDNLNHVVINSIAQKSLFLRKKIQATYIPNIFDFKLLNNPSYHDLKIKKDLRNFLGLEENDYLFLQPTRIIRRKNIERSFDFVNKLSSILAKKIYLLISGLPEKHEFKYFKEIIDHAKKTSINLILCNDFKNINTKDSNIKVKKVFKLFNIYDLYYACNLVTFPSDLEGFGNPVLEAAAFKKPLFVNNYRVLKDMLNKGFDFILINKAVDEKCLKKAAFILSNSKYWEKIAEKNFKIVKKYYCPDFLIKALGEILQIKQIKQEKKKNQPEQMVKGGILN
ncbi:MAG: glycosyltransferase family 4 protein [Actinobacteria bacterium]|nr:glycosyltransferase family 4 protein [Actinomycetota bacterium]